MRLNKYISHNTKYSRREADKLIDEGVVKLNRKPIKDFAYKVEDDDMVYIRDRRITPKKSSELTMIVYNKPKGVLVTKKDDRGRATIYHKLSGKYRHFIPVGRLDYASEGLLLLSDNTEVVSALMESDSPRSYNLKIDKPISPDMVVAMKEGLTLDDARAGGHKDSKIYSMEFAPFSDFVIRGEGKNYSKLRVTINEGKNRELRRFFGFFDAKILDLKRVSFGDIELNNLPENKTRYFTQREYDDLHRFMKKHRKDIETKEYNKRKEEFEKQRLERKIERKADKKKR